MGKKENAVERPVCQYAEQQGFEVRKIKYIQHEGAPDRMFYGYGLVFFIEFKSSDPDAELRPSQVREINKLRAAGIRTFVVDDVDDGKMLIDGAKMFGAEND